MRIFKPTIQTGHYGCYRIYNQFVQISREGKLGRPYDLRYVICIKQINLEWLEVWTGQSKPKVKRIGYLTAAYPFLYTSAILTAFLGYTLWVLFVIAKVVQVLFYLLTGNVLSARKLVEDLIP